MRTNGRLPLAALRPGESGVVDAVDGACPVGQRLLDLGFVPETLVKVLRRAPLGDPVVYDVRGTRLCLRRTEAARIRVRTVAAPHEELRKPAG